MFFPWAHPGSRRPCLCSKRAETRPRVHLLLHKVEKEPQLHVLLKKHISKPPIQESTQVHTRQALA